MTDNVLKITLLKRDKGQFDVMVKTLSYKPWGGGTEF